ncbi:hypothetical protein Taro_033388 [Colocasia esculenta]|uniref:Uncharacterized protein n=1 Tax=Colocasia esculenta TaxID=4460 RepID=A0A843W6V3_COLES|nr:hypothetical protein [Colocasia esculenta]
MKEMALRKGPTTTTTTAACCFALLLLQLQCACCEAGLERLHRLRGGFGMSPTKRAAAVHGGGGGLGGGGDEGGGVFAAEKRSVYMGANPLHNR